MVVLWSGPFVPADEDAKVIEALSVPFSEGQPVFLTRLEAGMGPSSMTDDVELALDGRPKEFDVEIDSQGLWWTKEAAAAQDDQGVTELMYGVVASEDTGSIASLLNGGADVNARDFLGVSALMYAARHSTNPSVLTTLLKAGADVQARNSVGGPALLYAAANPNPEVVTVLLEAGADVRSGTGPNRRREDSHGLGRRP
jgi:hypothetical protein